VNLEKQLIIAAERGYLKMVKNFVEQGADINAYRNHALRWSAHRGHLDVVKYLVEQGADINHTDRGLALSWAAARGHFEVVKYLVEQGTIVNAENDQALEWAIRHNHIEVVLYLKRIYSEKYKEKFLCHNCLVLPTCLKLCNKEILREGE
jgi:ankyrin repeat protein